jgi:hypothetical protein
MIGRVVARVTAPVACHLSSESTALRVMSGSDSKLKRVRRSKVCICVLITIADAQIKKKDKPRKRRKTTNERSDDDFLDPDQETFGSVSTADNTTKKTVKGAHEPDVPGTSQAEEVPTVEEDAHVNPVVISLTLLYISTFFLKKGIQLKVARYSDVVPFAEAYSLPGIHLPSSQRTTLRKLKLLKVRSDCCKQFD